MRLPRLYNHVLNDVVLGVKNNISEFSKILDDILVLKVTFDYYRARLRNSEVWVFDKLFDNRIQNSIKLLALTQPTPAAESESGICVFQEVDHIVQS